jgi:hypothetical protein
MQYVARNGKACRAACSKAINGRQTEQPSSITWIPPVSGMPPHRGKYAPQKTIFFGVPSPSRNMQLAQNDA